MTNRKQQRGLTFLGLLVVGILLALAGVVFAQVVPTYIEYLAVQKAVDKAATVDNISTIAGKDLEVGKEGNKVVVSFAYERDIHLTGPAYLVMRYQGRSK
jgi:hypothetical protein